MFTGFTKDAPDFLLGIRYNNSKDWFEPRKKIYTEQIYEPMKALTALIAEPFEKYGMISKTGRIYRDESFPPYLHYRDTIWIYVRYPAYYWNRTPTLYFELSPEGAEFGFRISHPEAAVMELFRCGISEEPENFLTLAETLRSQGIEFGGEEYKRKKKCSVPEAEEFFAKKGLSAYRRVTELSELSDPKLADRIIETFHAVQPLNELFHEYADIAEAAKLAGKEQSPQPEQEIPVVEAPKHDFMW